MMSLQASNYYQAFKNLLPPGKAFEPPDGSILDCLLLGFSQELSRLDARVQDMLNEVDPRTTYECLSDWERILGLPDTCAPEITSVNQRRQAVLTKLTAQGGQTEAYFIQLAATYGYIITISHFKPFTVDSGVDDPLLDSTSVFYWQVNAPLSTVTYWDVDSGVDDPLSSWGNSRLECLLNRYKPAHTEIVFSYSATNTGGMTGLYLDQASNSQYIPLM